MSGSQVRVLKSLRMQDENNFFAHHRIEGTKPGPTNTNFDIVKSCPTRVVRSKRSPVLQQKYDKLDEFLETLKSTEPYKLVELTDDVMGIAATDRRVRRNDRRDFVKRLGSNRFCFGKYTYSPRGSSTNYTIVFKVEGGALMTNEIVL